MIVPLLVIVGGCWAVDKVFNVSESRSQWISSRDKYSKHWLKEFDAGRTKSHVSSTSHKDVSFNR